MASICQVMIKDFMYGFGRLDGDGYSYYGRRDLVNGIFYARALIEDGYKKEPLHKYNLKRFIVWARNKYAEIRLQEKQTAREKEAK